MKKIFRSPITDLYMEIRVGCCGWCIRGGKRAYYKHFTAIEVQETFYKLPRPQTVSKWLSDAPEGFKFCMKSWQVITHPPSSPTWKRAGIKVPKTKIDKYGFLKPTQENLEAWEKILEVAQAMRAEVCVIQTPAAFGYSPENFSNAEQFFSTIKRDNVALGWEPRGTWREHLDVVKKLCDEHDMIHVVDPFRCSPVSTHGTAYFRLHGIGGKEVNYRYKYTDQDLRELKEIVEEMLKEGREKVYVFFNNVEMAEDAGRLVDVLMKSGLPIAMPQEM